MHRLLTMLYIGFMVGIGLGTVFQLALLPFIGMRSFDDWTGLLVWGFTISIVSGIISAISFWIMTVMMIRQGK